MRTLTARRVRRARRILAAQRCPRGGTHRWQEYAGVGAVGFESGDACVKCGATA